MYFLKWIPCLCLIYGSMGAKLPANLKRCHKTDKACLKEAIQDAVPKFAKGFRNLGVLGIDPLSIPQMVIPSSNGPVQLTQKFFKGFLYGLSTTQFEEIDFDVDNKKFTWKFNTKNLTLVADYEMTGHLMVFPVKGKGTLNVELSDIQGDEVAFIDIVKRDDGEHIVLKETQLKLEAGGVKFYFDNLFDGNKQLGDNINQVLNENWKTVFDEIKGSYNDGFKEFIDSIVQKFFDQVPLNEIFLD